MKYLKILLLLIGLTCADNARSDIIEDIPAYHRSYHTFTIYKAGNYPGMKLVAVALTSGKNPIIRRGMVVVSGKLYEMRQDVPLQFFMVDSVYLRKKNINKIQWNNDTNVKKLDFVLHQKKPVNLEKNTYSHDNFELIKTNGTYRLVLDKDRYP